MSKTKNVEKVTTFDRRCNVCLKSWPKGTTYFAPLKAVTFSCPDGQHELKGVAR